MNVINETKLENSSLELVIEIPAERVEEEFKAVFKKLQQGVKIDGFRKGKVPMPMLEQRYTAYASEEVAENLMKDSIVEVIREKALNPVATPTFEFNGLNRGEALNFKAVIELFPTVNIGEYKGIEVEEKTCAVQESDIDKEVESLRSHFKRTEVLEKGTPSEAGDMVRLKFKAINVEGDERVRTYSAVIGEDADEFAVEQNLNGMKIGEEGEITIKYPEDYSQTDVAGKEITYLVTIEEGSREVIPELTDELAKEAKFESVEDMRNKASEVISHFVANKTKGDAKASIINKIVLESTFELPETMINAEIESVFNRERERLAQRMGASSNMTESYTQEDVAAIFGMYPDEYKAHLRVEAENSLKTMLILSEVIKKEGLTVTDDQYREYIAKNVGDVSPDELGQFEQLVADPNFRANVERELAVEQAVEFLYNNAVVKKMDPITVEELLKS